MKRLACAAVLVVLMAVSVPLHAQGAVGILRGTVTDSASGRPVPAVQVIIPGRHEVVTGRDGSWQLPSVDAGAVELRFRRVGYAPHVTRLTLAAGETRSVDVTMRPVAVELAPVVVSATREVRSLAEVPVAVSVADSTVIQSGRTAGLHEVLRLTPGVQATSRFGLDDVNLSIRGSGVRTTFGVRGVAVVVDGVPVTEPDGQTRLDIIELGSARQVEVVRGPASALYGGTASGGVVNILSKSPLETRGMSVRASSGSFGFQKYDGTIGTANADGTLGAYLSGTWTESDGFRANNTNLMKRLNFRGEWAAAARTRLTLEASSSDLDMTIPGALTRGEFDTTPFAAEPATIANRYGRRDVRWRAGLKLDQGLDLAGRSGLLSAYAFYGGRELDHPIFQVIDQNLHRTQAGARLTLPLGAPGWRVAVGGDYDILQGSSERFVNQGGARGAVTVSQENRLPNLGTFAQVEGRIAPQLDFSLGGRYDRVEYGVVDFLAPAKSAEPSFTQFSPKATLSYRLGAAASAYATVARGFDVPTLGEMTASADPTIGFNPNLEPKRLWNYEAGVKSLVGGRLFVDASIYHQAITGELLPRNATVAGTNQTVTVYDNAGRSSHWGVELAASAFLTPDVDVGASYTWSRFELTDFTGTVTGANGLPQVVDFSGNRLPGVPEHRMAAELRVRPVEGLQLGVTGEWQSRLFVDNANTDAGTLFVRGFGPNPTISSVAFGQVDAWGLVHLAASYRVGGQTLFVNVENLFDARYVANATLNSANGRFYSAGAGRYIAAGVTLAAFGKE
jgi:iron complex outermembrane receptor protein